MAVRLGRTFVGALVLLLVLAAPLRAQDPLDARFKPSSEVLGAGDYKVVFGVEGRPDLVIAISKYDDANSTFMKEKLAREKADLERLEKAGAYVAKVEAIGTYEGRAALVMKRYEVGTKASEWFEARWSLLNETSILELKKIERALLRSGLEVQDLQFLVDKAGHVVIADPEEVGTKVHSPSDVKRSIAALIGQAEAAIAWRKLAVRLAGMPGAEDARLRELFTKREITTAWNDPAANARVVDALKVYLRSGATTDAAKTVLDALESGKVKLAHDGRWEGYAPNEVYFPFGGTFPRLAAELVVKVWDHLFGSGGAKHGADLLEKKGAPAEIVRELRPAVEGAFDPAAAIRNAREVGGTSLERGVERPGEASRTTGIGGGLERLVERRTAEARERVR